MFLCAFQSLSSVKGNYFPVRILFGKFLMHRAILTLCELKAPENHNTPLCEYFNFRQVVLEKVSFPRFVKSKFLTF